MSTSRQQKKNDKKLMKKMVKWSSDIHIKELIKQLHLDKDNEQQINPLITAFLTAKNNKDYENIIHLCGKKLMENLRDEKTFFLYAVTHGIVRKNQPNLIKIKIDEALFYNESPHLKHILLLLRAHSLIVKDKPSEAQKDLILLKDENCAAEILLHANNFQALIEQQLPKSNKSTHNSLSKKKEMTENHLKLLQEEIIKGNYFEAYQQSEIFLNSYFSTDDLTHPEEFYLSYSEILLNFHLILQQQSISEQKKFIEKIKFYPSLNSVMGDTIENFLTLSSRKHCAWNTLIKNTVVTYIEKNKFDSAQHIFKLINDHYQHIIAKVPDFHCISTAFLLNQLNNKIASLIKKAMQTSRSPRLEFLEKIKLQKPLELLPPISISTENWQKKINLLLDNFSRATNQTDYYNLILPTIDMLIFLISKEARGALDAIWYAYTVCRFVNYQNVTIHAIAEGIDYTASNEVKYVFNLLEAWLYFEAKKYDKLNHQLAKLADKEYWTESLVNKYQELRQHTFVNLEQATITDTTDSHVVFIEDPQQSIELSTRLDAIQQYIAAEDYLTAYARTQLLSEYIDEKNNNYVLYQKILVKIYLVFQQNSLLRESMAWSEEQCKNLFLNALYHYLNACDKKYLGWIELINYVALDHNDDYTKTSEFIFFLYMAKMNLNPDIIQFDSISSYELMQRLDKNYALNHQKKLEDYKKQNQLVLKEKQFEKKKIKQLEATQRKINRQMAHAEKMKFHQEEKENQQALIEEEKAILPNKETPILSAEVIKNKNTKNTMDYPEKFTSYPQIVAAPAEPELAIMLIDFPHIHVVNDLLINEKRKLLDPEKKIPIKIKADFSEENQHKNQQISRTPTLLEIAAKKNHKKKVKLFLHEKLSLLLLQRLHQMEKDLNQLGLSMVFIGRVVTKLGYVLYNDKPSSSSKIYPHHLNICVDVDNAGHFLLAMEFFQFNGFLLEESKEKHKEIKSYAELSIKLHDMEVKMLIRNQYFYESKPFNPFLSGKAVFSKKCDENSLFIADGDAAFALTILPDPQFKMICKSLHFSMSPPCLPSSDHPGTTAWCYGVFKHLQDDDDISTIDNYKEIIDIAEQHFIECALSTNEHIKKIAPIQRELREFFKNNVVLESNASVFINMLIKALLSRYIPHDLLCNNELQTLFTSALFKLISNAKTNFFNIEKAKIFCMQIDKLVNRFVSLHQLIITEKNESIGMVAEFMYRELTDTNARPSIQGVFSNALAENKPIYAISPLLIPEEEKKTSIVSYHST